MKNIMKDDAKYKYIINIPAPEEVRTWQEYVMLFKSRNHESNNLKDLISASGMKLKEWFEYCWQQEEAEDIYNAYQ